MLYRVVAIHAIQILNGIPGPELPGPKMPLKGSLSRNRGVDPSAAPAVTRFASLILYLMNYDVDQVAAAAHPRIGRARSAERRLQQGIEKSRITIHKMIQ